MHLKSFGAQPSGLRLERMRASPRFIDGAFANTYRVTQGLKKGTATPTIAEFLCGGQRRTPRAPLPSKSPLCGLAARPREWAARDLARPFEPCCSSWTARAC